eukprot:gb/GECG01002397.1/.p1 GENE.gb/GECG01002397.1/~~gb/GECG01002397.1/.p1  ORF type:complete len:538 (+),score=26.78 gb/GECG01002397.1/:1-1614(+)
MSQTPLRNPMAQGGTAHATVLDPKAAFDNDLESDRQKQRQLNVLLRELPWYERTLAGTHITDMVMVGIIATVAALIWLSYYPFHPKNAVKVTTGMFVFTAWIVTARMNYFVKKYLSLALKLYHNDSLEGLTAHLHTPSVKELSESAKSEEGAKKWMGFLPGHWAIYFKVATALVSVYQLCQPLLIPFREKTVIKQGFDIPVLNVSFISNEDDFRTFFWICYCLVALLWTATLLAFFVPMFLSEPWCLRYFKLFMQCLSIGIYETRNLPACFSWHLMIFRFLLRVLDKKLDKNKETQMQWAAQLFANLVTLVELTFVPVSIFLIKLVGCNNKGELIEVPTIECWTSNHVGLLFPALALLFCWYFLCVYAITWSVPLFSFESKTCEKFGWKSAFSVSELIVWSPIFQYKALNLRMLLTIFAIILGPTEPVVISPMLALTVLGLFWSHGFIPSSNRYYPCNIAQVNYWYGASLALVVTISLETCICVWISSARTSLVLDTILGVTIFLYVCIIIAVSYHSKLQYYTNGWLGTKLMEDNDN